MNRLAKTLHLLSAVLLLTQLNPHRVWGQTDAPDLIRQQLETYRNRTLQEKLFVHTDRSFYVAGELIWFKINYVDGLFHQPLSLSKVAYLEVLDRENRPVLQTKVALAGGAGNGSLFLPTTLGSGNYLIRAYTNWMKNFGPEGFFEKPVTIVNSFRKLELPVLKDTLAYDVQFFPEGGNLVRGLSSTVAFKATDANGKGVDLQGVVVDQNNDTVARLKPLRLGMGRFALTPAEGQQYRAVLTDAQGKTVARPLPAIQPQGYTMQVEETGTDQLRVTVRTGTAAASAYLLVHTRLTAIRADQQPFRDNTATFAIDKKTLGEGVSHLTVFDASRKPVCERLYFKRPEKRLALDAKLTSGILSTREKAVFELNAQDETGKPVLSDLSVAVYRLDSLQLTESGDIASYLLLTSDLRGAVENPTYYFTAEGSEVAEATDNLMLTQGWRRFRWETVLQSSPPEEEYVPEVNGHFVRGKLVHGATGQPGRGLSAYLSVPGKHILLYGSRSDSEGRVQFEMKEFFGPKDLVIQLNPRDSIFRAELQNPFLERYSASRLPVFDFPASLQSPLLARSVPMQVQNAYYRENLVRYHLPQVDSVAFYGTPDEKYRLDDFTRFPVMEEVFREYVPGVMARKRREGYSITVLDIPHKQFFTGNPLALLDGVPLFDMDKVMAIDPRKVQKLEVMARHYIVGPLVFDGIISFTTYKGDLAGYRPDAKALLADYEGLQIPRDFYAPRYDTPQRSGSRLPDMRTLLYWTPALKTDAQGKAQFDFYTSDEAGTFRFVINGITADGRAGSKQGVFEVAKVIK
ncbi:Plug domain-containing protein [Larkinella ripae]